MTQKKNIPKRVLKASRGLFKKCNASDFSPSLPSHRPHHRHVYTRAKHGLLLMRQETRNDASKNKENETVNGLKPCATPLRSQKERQIKAPSKHTSPQLHSGFSCCCVRFAGRAFCRLSFFLLFIKMQKGIEIKTYPHSEGRHTWVLLLIFF